jgi:hypothetical protein
MVRSGGSPESMPAGVEDATAADPSGEQDPPVPEVRTADVDSASVPTLAWSCSRRWLTSNPLAVLLLVVVPTLAALLVPETTGTGRLGWAVAAATGAFLLIVVVSFSIFLLAAPYMQRNAARTARDQLAADLAERQRPRFKMTPSAEYLGDVAQAGAWSDVYVLWVTVTNEGPVAEFTARITNAGPVAKHDATGADATPYSVMEVAWENALTSKYEIPRGHSARLKVAYLGHSPTGPTALWFWTASTTTWAGGDYGVGWWLRPGGSQVMLDLTVSSVQSDTSRTVGYATTFDATGDFVSFTEQT